jgi:hypothetical protein
LLDLDILLLYNKCLESGGQMAQQDLKEKTVRELRTMAKRAGIAAKGDWKKEDFIKALSPKKKSSAKPGNTAKTAKKTVTRKPAAKNSTAHKTAGKPAVKKSVKKTSAAKAKSALRKAPPKKTPWPASGAVSLKPHPGQVPAPLPAEYREDKIVTMPVTPGRIYVYWEIPEYKLVKCKGSLNLKVFDKKTDSFFYTPVSGRIGESFVNINPDSDYSIKIGIIDCKGEFVNISQSEPSVSDIHTVLTSEWHPGEILSGEQPEMTERALPEEFFEMPGPLSSY